MAILDRCEVEYIETARINIEIIFKSDPFKHIRTYTSQGKCIIIYMMHRGGYRIEPFGCKMPYSNSMGLIFMVVRLGV